MVFEEEEEEDTTAGRSGRVNYWTYGRTSCWCTYQCSAADACWGGTLGGWGSATRHAATVILMCLAPFFIFIMAAINIDDEAARLSSATERMIWRQASGGAPSR